MADISQHLKAIQTAKYGEEVRGSIHDALEAMNEESSSAKEVAETAQDSAKASAAAAAKSASSAKTSETNAKSSETKAKTSETNATNSASSASTSASNAASSASAAKTSETNAKSSETKALNAADKAKEVEANMKNYFCLIPLLDSNGNKILDSDGNPIFAEIKGVDNVLDVLCNSICNIREYEAVNTLRYMVKQLAPGETFTIKPGMEGRFFPYNNDVGVYHKDGSAIVSSMGAGDFLSEEIGEGVLAESQIEYPFGKDAQCETVSGIEAGLDVLDDILRLKGKSNGGFLGGYTWGSYTTTGVTVKFDLYIGECEKFRFAPTSFDNFSSRVRYGLDITETGEICKLVITEVGSESDWVSESLDEPLYVSLNEWHEFVLSYGNNGDIDVYMNGNRIFGWTGIDMPRGTPTDFAFIGGESMGKTYMNNIEMYFAPYNSISQSNLKHRYMQQTMQWEHRISFRYVSGLSYKSYHHRFPEGVYFKNNNTTGTAYFYYTVKGK